MKKILRNKKLLSACLACIIALCACGQSGESTETASLPETAAAVSQAADAKAEFTETKDGVTVTLSTDKAAYAAGEEIHFKLVIENKTEDWTIAGRRFQYTNSAGLVPSGDLDDNLPSIKAGGSVTIEGTLTGGSGEEVIPEAAGSSTKISFRPYVNINYGGKDEMVRCILNLKMTQEVREFAGSRQNLARTVSVHDPSVFKDKDGKYYLVGTHITSASSEDLFDWTDRTGDLRAAISPETRERIREWNKDDPNGDWFGYLWAPDIIYNEAMGKYCMYLSANGDDWKSNIVLLTADSLYGPYDYAGSVVYGGFTEEDFDQTDLPQVLGTDTLPERYIEYGVKNKKWGDMFPNCIDPCVFYDEDGGLWMTYGSWSGGIFMLKLDNNTGLRDCSVSYSTEEHSDSYFGKLLAGGWYVSGEGSYIQHIGDYYYLFITYGGLEAKSGYNIRVFRSERPDGDYVDEQGNTPYFDRNISNVNMSCGIRLFGGYKWPTMNKAQVSQGHNSAFVDDDGKAYIVFHTRTDDGTEGHYVKVHQLFVNEDGWLVASPYATHGETLNEYGYSAADVVGKYDIIFHDINIDYANYGTGSIKTVTLYENGSFNGDYEGTWDIAPGKPYITLDINGETYSGVVVQSEIEGSDVKTMTFSAVGRKSQVTLWGSRSSEQ